MYFSALAEADLEEISDYIARDNPHRALSFIDEIREQCSRIPAFPQAFPLREELDAGIRAIPFGRYPIFCTQESDTKGIGRILPGSRLSSSDYVKN